jgi:hypothetical protein
LDLDVAEVLTLYRTIKIQEQPVPVDQLFKKNSIFLKTLIVVLSIIAGIGIIGGGIFFFVSREPEIKSDPVVVRKPAEYEMTGNTFERRLYINDVLFVSLNDNKYKFEFGNLSDVITIRTPFGFQNISLGSNIGIDLDSSGDFDIEITCLDFDKNKPDSGALLRVTFVAPLVADSQTEDSSQSIVNADVLSQLTTEIILSPNAYPFTLQAGFQGNCMFQWEILSESDRRGTNNRFFQRADEFNVSVQNGIRIWASNANAARLQVIGGGRTYPVELGVPGEVVVAEIKWVRDEAGRFRLVLQRMETISS